MLSLLGDLMFHQKLCPRCDIWKGMLSWWSCQSSVAHSCGLLKHQIVSVEECSSLTKTLVHIYCIYLLSHFECDGHTVHKLNQWLLSPPLISTVKSSLFTHAHPSPLPLAARLHQCGANHSCYINNGWTFSGQTSLYTTYGAPAVCQTVMDALHAKSDSSPYFTI